MATTDTNKFCLDVFLRQCRRDHIELTAEQLEFYTSVFTKLERAEHKAAKFAQMADIDEVEDEDEDEDEDAAFAEYEIEFHHGMDHDFDKQSR